MVFPATIDNNTDPTSNDKLNNPSHSTLHINQDATLVGLQNKVGIDSSAVTTSHDYLIANPKIVNNRYYKSLDNAGTGDVDLIKADTSDNIVVGVNNADGHTIINAGTSKLVKIKVLRQNDTSNSYEENTVFLSGWGKITGDGASQQLSETVTFGITFSQAPIVLSSSVGAISGTASAISDFNVRPTANSHQVNVYGTSTTQFTAEISRQTGNWGAGIDNGYGWLAIGELN